LIGGGIIIGSDPNAQNNSNTIDGQETVGGVMSLVGLVGDLVGVFKITDSKADQFNAVQRYNAVIYKNRQTTWNLPRPGIHADLFALNF
jgi:hypothetical protein